MTMIRTVLSAAAILLAASGAYAQTQAPSALGTFNDWTAWTFNGSILGGDTEGKVCYIYSKPTDQQPGNLNHGDVSFSVSRSQTENIASQANFVTGYPFEENSTVTVDIDGKTFTMFTQGESAWMLNTAEEPDLLGAMRAGRNMTVRAKSRRGNDTTYQFSLSGVTAASDKIVSDCQ